MYHRKPQGNLYKTNITHNVSTELNIDHEVSLEPVKSSSGIEVDKESRSDIESRPYVGGITITLNSL